MQQTILKTSMPNYKHQRASSCGKAFKFSILFVEISLSWEILLSIFWHILTSINGHATEKVEPRLHRLDLHYAKSIMSVFSCDGPYDILESLTTRN